MDHGHGEVGVLAAAPHGGIDAHHLAALEADQRPARVARVDRGVGLQHLQHASELGGDAGNDAARAGVGKIPGMAEGADDVADRRHLRAVQRGGLQARRPAFGRDFQHGQIDDRVDVKFGGRDVFTAAERHVHHGRRARHDVGVGENPAALGVDHEPGAVIGTAMVAEERQLHPRPHLDGVVLGDVERLFVAGQGRKPGQPQNRDQQTRLQYFAHAFLTRRRWIDSL